MTLVEYECATYVRHTTALSYQMIRWLFFEYLEWRKRYVKTRVTKEMDRTLQIVKYLVGRTQKILISLPKTKYFLDKIDENTFINWYNTI